MSEGKEAWPGIGGEQETILENEICDVMHPKIKQNCSIYILKNWFSELSGKLIRINMILSEHRQNNRFMR